MSPARLTSVRTDVREWGDVQGLVGTVEESFGPIDVFVSNAGLRQVTVTNEEGKPVPDIDLDVWNAVIETNLTGMFLCTKAALPGMLGRGEGRMIYLASGLGEHGKAGRSPYAASKFGLNGFRESLAYEPTVTEEPMVRLAAGAGENGGLYRVSYTVGQNY